MKIAGTTTTRYDITWKSDPLPLDIYTYLTKHVYRHSDYGAVTPAYIAELTLMIESAFPHYDVGGNITKIASARNIILKGKIIKNYARVHAQMQRITHEYADASIITLSHKYDFPPLHLLYKILAVKYGDDVARAISSGKKSPRQVLDKRDLHEHAVAEQHDAETLINQRIITEKALENERRFVKYFTSQGISLQTQDDLIAEQLESKVKLTPDILFADEVYINGKLVKWIDYKDYICTSVNFLFSKNVDQAEKYYRKWGEGALCYRLSFVDNITIPHAQLLDGSFTNIDFIL